MNTFIYTGFRSNQLWPIIISIAKDKVFRAMILIAILLAIVDLSQLAVSTLSTLESLWEMLPFFALAIGVAGSRHL